MAISSMRRSSGTMSPDSPDRQSRTICFRENTNAVALEGVKAWTARIRMTGVQRFHHCLAPGAGDQGIHQRLEALVRRLSYRIGKWVFLFFEKTCRIGRIGIDCGLEPAINDFPFFRASACAELIYNTTPHVPGHAPGGRNIACNFSDRIVPVETQFNGRKPGRIQSRTYSQKPLFCQGQIRRRKPASIRINGRFSSMANACFLWRRSRPGIRCTNSSAPSFFAPRASRRSLERLKSK